ASVPAISGASSEGRTPRSGASQDLSRPTARPSHRAPRTGESKMAATAAGSDYRRLPEGAVRIHTTVQRQPWSSLSIGLSLGGLTRSELGVHDREGARHDLLPDLVGQAQVS